MILKESRRKQLWPILKYHHLPAVNDNSENIELTHVVSLLIEVSHDLPHSTQADAGVIP